MTEHIEKQLLKPAEFYKEHLHHNSASPVSEPVVRQHRYTETEGVFGSRQHTMITPHDNTEPLFHFSGHSETSLSDETIDNAVADYRNHGLGKAFRMLSTQLARCRYAPSPDGFADRVLSENRIHTCLNSLKDLYAGKTFHCSIAELHQSLSDDAYSTHLTPILERARLTTLPFEVSTDQQESHAVFRNVARSSGYQDNVISESGTVSTQVPAVSQQTTSLAITPRASEGVIPDNVFWGYIQNVMVALDQEFLSVYEQAVARQTEFWRKFTEIQDLSIPNVNKDKEFEIQYKLVEELQALLPISPFGYLYLSHKSMVLFPLQTDDSDGLVLCYDEAEAQKWVQELGLPESCLHKQEGGYIVLVDYTPIQGMLDDFTTEELEEGQDPEGEGIMTKKDTSEYQAWLSAFNAHVEDLKTTSQTVATKYSNANSVYDSVIKLLNSTISAMMEAAKTALNAMR